MSSPDPITPVWLFEEQKQWEIEGARRGLDRFNASVKGKSLDELPPGRRIVGDALPALAARLDPPSAKIPVLVEPNVMAYLAIGVLLRHEGPRYSVGGEIGRAIVTEHAKQLQSKGREKLVDKLAQRCTKSQMRGPRRAAFLDTVLANDGSDLRMLAELGDKVLAEALDALPEVVVSTKRTGADGNFDNFIELAEAVGGTLLQWFETSEISRPMKLPMLCPPLPQSATRTSGYIFPVSRIGIAKGSHVPSDHDVAAINAVQMTAWEVNPFIIAVAKAQPPAVIPEVQPRMDEAEYEALTDEGKLSVRREAAIAHGKRRSAISKARNFVSIVSTAEEMATKGRFWFPYFRDYRGRVYPDVDVAMHPQSEDIGKASLRFHVGKPLGERGLYWLRVRAANMFGNDKAPMADRAKWAIDNAEMISRIATDPAGTRSLWEREGDGKKRKTAWQFLATCDELHRANGNPEFVSHLPVQADGSCNGIQHLAAMSADSEAAETVNLTPGERRDVYAIVSARAEELLAADNSEQSLRWRGRLKRAAVKRPTMTSNYGVTASGIRGQLLDKDDEGRSTVGDDEKADLVFVGNVIEAAIKAASPGPAAIRDWVQECSRIRNQAGLPLVWTTPNGSVVTQSIKELKKVRLNIGGTQTTVPIGTSDKLEGRKQTAASAPNVVHSLDAAHLLRVALEAHKSGLSLSLVHDSFGCHAADYDTMARILRVQFATIYMHDVLLRLWQDFSTTDDGGIEMPEPPIPGTWEPTSILASEYAFS